MNEVYQDLEIPQKPISISYAITVCNELEELKQLLAQIEEIIQEQDEIVVQWDSQNGSPFLKEYLDHINIQYEFKGIQFHRIQFPLNNDFAAFKNNIKEHCSKDFIFQIDADETLGDNLSQNLHALLETNREIDLILVPRENYVEGITPEDIQRWGWRIDEQNRINYPDNQMRIIRNKPGIVWKNRVHEQIIGYQTLSTLPYDVQGWCLIHNKNISKQRIQNEFYANI